LAGGDALSRNAKLRELGGANDRLSERATSLHAYQVEIDEVRLTPIAGQLTIELRGDLAGTLRAIEEYKQTLAKAEENALQIKLVAGAGFEPTTFRL
jgi:hypothetical protein